MDLRLTKTILLDDLVALYDAVGWHAYTQDPKRLVEAVRRSTYVVSIWEDNQLVGLARGLRMGAPDGGKLPAALCPRAAESVADRQ